MALHAHYFNIFLMIIYVNNIFTYLFYSKLQKPYN
jgi:hypothetical protein